MPRGGPIAFCTIERCTKPVHGNGLCNTHYRRSVRGTVPVDAPPAVRQGWSLPERLMDRIEHDTNGGCWLWTGAVNHWGYGRIGLEETRDVDLTHRVSWRLFRGAIEAGKSVLHRCDVPTCCNPAHLFLGTQLDNMRDMMAKGRSVHQRRAAANA